MSAIKKIAEKRAPRMMSFSAFAVLITVAAVHTVAEQGSDTVAVVVEQAADTEAEPVHLPAEPVLERLLTFRSCKQHCLQAVLRNIYRISW